MKTVFGIQSRLNFEQYFSKYSLKYLFELTKSLEMVEFLTTLFVCEH
jgi:hypothetical protein